MLPRWFRQVVAISALFLYSGDVGSDFWVGIDLIKRCHRKFAASVFTWLAIPGFLDGWAQFMHTGECNAKAFLRALFMPILMIPLTLWRLFKSARDIDDRGKLKDAKFYKGLEVVFEAIPQDTLADIGLSLNSTSVSDSYCTDICSKEYDEFCIERWKYLPPIQHQIIQIVLSVLFGMSILEWILESCYDFMPYVQLYKVSKSKTDNGSDSEGQKGETPKDAEEALPLQILSTENETNKSEENHSDCDQKIKELQVVVGKNTEEIGQLKELVSTFAEETLQLQTISKENEENNSEENEPSPLPETV